MTDLLPCPCCLSTEVFTVHASGATDYDCVICNACGLSATRADVEGEPHDVWNRREQKVLTDQEMWDIAVGTAGSILVGWDDTVVLDIERPSDLSEVVRAILAAMK